MNVNVGQPVELRVARRTDEDYKPPPRRPGQAFEGTGNRLGAPVPDVIRAYIASALFQKREFYRTPFQIFLPLLPPATFLDRSR